MRAEEVLEQEDFVRTSEEQYEAAIKYLALHTFQGALDTIGSRKETLGLARALVERIESDIFKQLEKIERRQKVALKRKG